MYKLSFQQITSAGDRDYNQDYMLNKIDEDYSLFVLADGLGGHQAGEKASRYFCHSFIHLASQYAPFLQKSPRNCVAKWFDASINMMADAFQGDPVAKDAYTTCVILILTNKFVLSVHCGDSRLYRLDQHGIKWRTHDHSMTQQLLDEGTLEEYKMGTHPDQNKLTRSININHKYPPEINIDLPPVCGETFVLCSDGFWEFTKEHEFITLANKAVSRDYLLKQAKLAIFRSGGKSDNLTIQWIRIKD